MTYSCRDGGRGSYSNILPPVPTGQPRPYLVHFWLNYADLSKKLYGALLVAISLLNTYLKFPKFDLHIISD